MADSTPKDLYLVDGSGYIFRAFHALPPMTRKDGTPVNAVYGFTNMLLKLVDDAEADYLAVIFDAARVSFRNEIYADYKAQRPDPPEELIPQFALIREAVRACSLPCIEMEGWEADDIIATYARQAVDHGLRVTIVSSDKDLMQLVGDGIAMFDPMKNRPIGPDEVVEKFGVGPDRVVDVQALAGDSVDNVPGVPGIGVKTAAQLITEFGDLESLLAKAETIKQPKRRQNLIEFAEQARISRDLVKLRDDVPLPEKIESFAKREPDQEMLLAFLRDNDFKSTLAKMQSRFGAAAAGTETAPDPGAAEREAEISYELVQDRDALKAWVDHAWDVGTVAVDTETDSLDANRATLVGVSLSVEAGKACYIPLRHRSGGGDGDLAFEDGPRQIGFDDAIALLKPLLESDAVLKVGQNIKYDWLVFARPANGGIEMRNMDDTMVLSYVLEGGLHGHGMDELSELHLGHKPISYKEVAGTGKGQVTFDQVPLDKARDYAAEDADITGRLHRLLKPRLVSERLVTVYETLERPLIPILARMEREGIKVDRQVLQRMSGDFGKRIGGLEEEIHKLAGHPFNIGSPKQLGDVLYGEMGLQAGRKTKSGGYSTNSDALEPLAAQGVEIAAKVLDWRALSKLKSTYADALVDDINPDTGRVHTSFAMAIASTGRLSSTDPNLQNIPIRTEEGRRIREAFVPAEGFKLLSVDYSQVELRLVAHIAGVAALKQAFQEGVDIHALTASQVFGIPIEEMDGETRRKAKAINFGIIYGISGFGLSQQLGIAQSEASAYIRQYLDKLPELKDWLDARKKEARERGYVETLFGRRIHIKGANDKNPNMRGFADRQAINAPIQGSAADVIKRAMIRVPTALSEAGLKARMLLQVHDELLFEVPVAEVDKTSEVVRRTMETACLPTLQLDVPLVAEAGVGDNWAQAH